VLTDGRLGCCTLIDGLVDPPEVWEGALAGGDDAAGGGVDTLAD
jgi:hypothetical protein